MAELTLAELLTAKEVRSARQQALLARYKTSLLSFTLNIPGLEKVFPLAEHTFRRGLEEIRNQLKRNNAAIHFQEDVVTKAGYEARIAVGIAPEILKTWMIEIEDHSPAGRLWDIDILSPQGVIISRTDLGYPLRKCLLCPETAHACSRSKRHDLKELNAEVRRIMTDRFREHEASVYAAFASRALLYEVSVSPKPGLVDRFNPGAHRDMDLYTFYDSTAALSHYFREAVVLGFKHASETPSEIFQRLRYPGKLAEDSMLRATGEVNTHKGLIFSLGILLAAAGALVAKEQVPKPDRLCAFAAAMTVGILDDFQRAENLSTAGAKLYLEHRISGIRGEVAGGFPTVRQYGLPVLSGFLAKGASIDRAGMLTLLSLMAEVSDTNQISRTTLEVATQAQAQVRQLIRERGLEGISEADVEALDREFCSLNLSPGGAADLLAVSFFLWFCESRHKSTFKTIPQHVE